MIGIISAMQEEIQAILEKLENKTSTTKGKRTYYQGQLFEVPVILVFSRWGKVAAATTVTQLINDFSIDEIIFTGVAGAIQKNIAIGDIVIGKELYQHDMDASPLLKPFEIPLLQTKFFESSPKERAVLQKAAQQFLGHLKMYISTKEVVQFDIKSPKIHIENIASGDQFISTNKQLNFIKNNLPDIACVEMEGAAIAQVCYEYSIPFNILRTISDNANDNAHIDFPLFAKKIASYYALGILKEYFALMRSKV